MIAIQEIIKLGYRMYTEDEKQAIEDGRELNFEAGDSVDFRCSHCVVTGLTQEAGKTTALEKMSAEAIDIDKKVVAFLTKKDEGGFQHVDGTEIRPFFKDEVDWEYVVQILETAMNRSMDFEESWIINAVDAEKYPFLNRAETLEEVHNNISELLRRHRDKEEHPDFQLRGLTESVYTSLEKYFEKVVPKIEQANLTTELELHEGLNIMDLRHLDREIQALVIGRTIKRIYEEFEDVIVVLPEAWKFLPQGTGSPCKAPVETFIREAAEKGDYLWIDSQDMTGMDKQPLKQTNNWILGYQREKNEVDRTRDQMPMAKRQAPGKEEIMSLKIGEFFLCDKSGVKKVYVDPIWINEIEIDGKSGEELARAVAKGEISSEEVKRERKKQMAEREGEEDDQEQNIESEGDGETLSDESNEDDVEAGKEELEKRLNTLSERIESLKQQVEASQETIEEKDRKIEELKEERDEYENKVENLKADVERLREEVDKPDIIDEFEEDEDDGFDSPISNVKDTVMEKTTSSESEEERQEFEGSTQQVDEEIEEKLDQVTDAMEDLNSRLNQQQEQIQNIEESIEEEVEQVIEEKDLSGKQDYADDIFDQALEEIQQAAVDSLMEEVDELSTLGKKTVYFLESRGKSVDSQTQLAQDALGYQKAGGRASEVFSNLRDKGFIRVASNGSVHPNLEEKVKEELEGYDATEEQIQDVRKRIFAELKEEVGDEF